MRKQKNEDRKNKSNSRIKTETFKTQCPSISVEYQLFQDPENIKIHGYQVS